MTEPPKEWRCYICGAKASEDCQMYLHSVEECPREYQRSYREYVKKTGVKEGKW